MRRLDLSDYTIRLSDEKGEPIEVPYLVRSSLASLLIRPDLHLSAVEVLQREKLVLRILDGPSPLLLEEADYDKLKSSVDLFRGQGPEDGWTRNDVELIRRVLEAPTVEVVEAKT